MWTRYRLLAAFLSTALFVGAFACSEKDPAFALDDSAGPEISEETKREPSQILQVAPRPTLASMTRELFAAPTVRAPRFSEVETAPVPRDPEMPEVDVIPASPGAIDSGSSVSGGRGSPRCGIGTLSLSFPARDLRTEELPAVTFPYVSTLDKEALAPELRRDAPVIALGTPTATVDEIGYVDGAQVAFAFDLTNLPARDAVIQLEEATLHAALTKADRGGSLESELFCFVDERLCSGMQDPSLRDNLNPLFFAGIGASVGPVNELFALRVVDDREPARAGDSLIHRAVVSLPLEELIRFAPTGLDVLDLLYGSDSAPHRPLAQRTIRAAVANHTGVGPETRLDVTLVVDECRAAELALEAAREAAAAAAAAPPVDPAPVTGQ
jgi:hypothetical protein